MPRKARTYLQLLRETSGQTARPAADRRVSSARRGYGRQWRNRRGRIARRVPMICAECQRVAKGMQLDHIVPRSQGGTDDEGNLQWLCPRCHSRKTAAADGGFGNARRA